MRREEFLKQLEYLLQDIPEEEKRDAIDYYRDYLEEAGPEREEEVLNGFGSPERIAAMIRDEMGGGAENAGEFTDHGFEDQRFSTSAYPTVPGGGKTDSRGPSREGGDAGARGTEGNGGFRNARPNGEYEKGSYARRRTGGYRSSDGKNSGSTEKNGDGRWWKYLLIGLGALIVSPFVLAAFLGLAGGVFGLVGALFGCLLALAALTFCAFIGGVSLIVVGIIQMFPHFWVGLMFTGLGLIAMGIGCLLLFCSCMFYGRFLPWLVKSIVGLFKKPEKGKDSRGGQPG